MRSIRRAAIAGATAASLILGAASVASADEATNTTQTEKKDEGSSRIIGSSDDSDKGKSEDEQGKVVTRATGQDHCASGELRSTSSCIGDKLEADKAANGKDLFGSTTDTDSQPKWAQYMKIVTILGVLGSFFGLVAFPAYNFAVANHLLPGQLPS